MKILHILDHSLPIHSGYSFRSEQILRAQVMRGFEVVARTGPKQYEIGGSQAIESQIEYRRSPYSNKLLGSTPVVNQLETIRVLRRDICSFDVHEQIDLIHAHSPSLNGIAAILAARSRRLPIVYEMRASWEDAAVDHGTTSANSLRYRLTRASESWVMTHADAITTICQGLKDDICARGIPREKVSIIPNAVDSDLFRPLTDSSSELRREFEAEGRFVLVFCGSFYFYEGLDLLVEAVARLATELPNILLLLAGGGEQEEGLRNQVEALRIGKHVRFLGRVSQQSVVRLYNLADACVFPRRRIRLTEHVTPLKPLEAMAAGALVLASDVGGHRELVADQETGLLYNADDSNDFLNSIRGIAGGSPYTAVRAAARQFVVSERTWSRCVSEYDEVYQRVTSAKD